MHGSHGFSPGLLSMPLRAAGSADRSLAQRRPD
jgi:hypothetical protein